MSAPVAASGDGVFVVSLDLELFWGVHDVARLEDHGETLLRVRSLVPKLLELFERYDIHATWAAVGFLFFRTKENMTQGLPRCLPKYAHQTLSPYARFDRIGPDEASDPYHFAPSILDAIRKAPHQEVGSHTFSHYYCLEEAQTAEAFREDLHAAIAVARQLGVTLRSLVFPRNQVNPAYLEICRDAGIVAYRGTERCWLYRPRPYAAESCIRRLARLADAFFNLTGHHLHAVEAGAFGTPVNVPASRLLRRYLPGLRWLAPLRIRRITKAMTSAARQGKMFHLWMHPEQLAEHPDEMLGMLEEILAHYRDLRLEYGLDSLNMGEVADRMLSCPESETFGAVFSAASGGER